MHIVAAILLSYSYLRTFHFISTIYDGGNTHVTLFTSGARYFVGNFVSNERLHACSEVLNVYKPTYPLSARELPTQY